jgi:hypothetical protein
MNIATLKMTLMQAHQVATRGKTNDEVIHLAYTHNLINYDQYADYCQYTDSDNDTPTVPAPDNSPLPKPPKAKKQDVNPMTTKTEDLALQIAELLTGSNSPAPIMDEGRIIELIKKHSTAPTHTVVASRLNDTEQEVNVGVTHACFNDALDYLTAGLDLYFCGRSGSGKSTTANQLAKSLDLPLYGMGSILSKFEIMGSLSSEGYNPSAVRKWLESTTGAVLLCDEIDGSDPRALVNIMPIFDVGGQITFPDGETLTRKAHHMIVVTANTSGTGATAEYNGRVRLDLATRNRFIQIEHDFDPNIEFSLAPKAIVNLSHRIRAVVTQKGLKGTYISPRTIKQAGKVYALDLPLERRVMLLKNIYKQSLTDNEFAVVVREANFSSTTLA